MASSSESSGRSARDERRRRLVVLAFGGQEAIQARQRRSHGIVGRSSRPGKDAGRELEAGDPRQDGPGRGVEHRLDAGFGGGLFVGLEDERVEAPVFGERPVDRRMAARDQGAARNCSGESAASPQRWPPASKT